ncbi:MAG: hemerythrin domain-containing protein [Saprospirales bacterium]|nr:hemerythrin domain-containing protein [Saprospirales bacterium]MBK8920894.1 hemerythrin domain-containing protein [Saprospirales bacterium]
MIELKVINQNDPLQRAAEKQHEHEEFSPMDPPDAYAPPSLDAVPYDELHPFLQDLMDEHKAISEQLDVFEKALLSIPSEGMSRETLGRLRDFFEFFDHQVAGHHQREDKQLFPLLRRRLLASGEHGKGGVATTSVDVMEDDHIKSLQLAAVVFNFFGIAVRLPDPASRLMVLDAALEQGKSLVELMRLHIFREDNIVFVQAHQLLTQAELEEMQTK